MSDNTSCCQEDFKTLQKFTEHVLNVHAGPVPPWQDPWPDHDHRHFKCCGQFFHGEEAFRLHVARAHAGVDVDGIRELRRHLEGRVPEELQEPEEDEAGEDEATPEAEAKAAGEADGEEVDLSDLSPKERAIQKAKLIAKRKKKEQGG